MSDARLRARVAEREWYHTIELAPGIVTPGWFDTRSVARRLPIPPRLTGQRCLDIGTFDGFWAFEMERRGGEVTAIDILDDRRWDWPANTNREDREAIERRKGRGDGFLIAREALGARVERADCSIYDLDPAIHGHFDFVYLGSLLLHLRDPVLALERVRSVTRGQLLIVDAIALVLTIAAPRSPVLALNGDGRPYWLKPNLAGLKRMAQAAGWQVVAGPRPLLMPAGGGFHYPSGVWRTLFTRWGREALLTARLGDPHAALLLTPGS
ncbi:MAG: methyltransferase domain-containing protein [Actinomycetota bacterium]|nr:methyltransferase domain-containing protein [Actinomycetota bacterium]